RMTDSSLLNSELELQQQEELYQQLLFQVITLPLFYHIWLAVSLCVKTFSEPNKQKVFINICQSTSVPPPPELSREELVQLLQSEDPSGYRVPMSLGEPHAETDNNSQGCTAYDVVINQDFFQKINLELNRDWKVLKNRKFLGSVSEQNIRTKGRPVIQELHSAGHMDVWIFSVLRPECSLVVEPPTGHPEYLIAEIKLPGVSSSRSLVLDVGEDRLVLTARPSLYHLDIFHPFLVDQQNSVAQYNKSTQILTVTMPVGSSAP
uniref:PIH1 domain-containing protein 1 n=1 Tax=Xiphophorus couchianus TaxID=32473 RepID=A0A3B5M363_9TELE